MLPFLTFQRHCDFLWQCCCNSYWGPTEVGLMNSFYFQPPGDRCEFDRRQGRCVPGVCRNGGTCRELSGGGFRCECPAGGYERPYCTVTARSFPPKSFVMFRGLRQRFHLSFSLTWVVNWKFYLFIVLSLFFFSKCPYLTIPVSFFVLILAILSSFLTSFLSASISPHSVALRQRSITTPLWFSVLFLLWSLSSLL